MFFVFSSLTGCYVLFFPMPKKEKFVYHPMKIVDNTSLKTNGIYYRIEQDEGSVFDSTDSFISKDILKFNKNGMMFMMSFGSDDTLLRYGTEFAEKELLDDIKMNYKGFFFIRNDTLKIEHLTGSAGHGYFFLYYDGVFKNEQLIIKQTGNRRVGIAMKEFEVMDTIPKAYKFKLLNEIK